MISALYVRKDSIYKSLGLDCWDIDRDSRNFSGLGPVIAHPPCRAWGQLSHMAKPRHDEKELAIHAIGVIRKNGGVLEHPSGSKLWPTLKLPKPGTGPDEYGGISILINQFWFGHKAEKKTLLYIVGVKAKDLPLIPMRFDAIEYTIASKIKKKSGRRIKKEVTKKEREETPERLAKWLIEVCELIK
jgi:hypothetical protein